MKVQRQVPKPGKLLHSLTQSAYHSKAWPLYLFYLVLEGDLTFHIYKYIFFPLHFSWAGFSLNIHPLPTTLTHNYYWLILSFSTTYTTG